MTTSKPGADRQQPLDVYVSGALSGLSPDLYAHATSLYEAVALGLQNAGLRPYCPHRSTTAPGKPMAPAEVWRIDHERVVSSQLLVAYVGLPSLGVGAEIEMANRAGIPVVLVVETGRLDAVSRLIRGCPSVVDVIEFTDMDDLPKQMQKVAIRLAADSHAHLPVSQLQRQLQSDVAKRVAGARLRTPDRMQPKVS